MKLAIYLTSLLAGAALAFPVMNNLIRDWFRNSPDMATKAEFRPLQQFSHE
jgi:hypothetical protein